MTASMYVNTFPQCSPTCVGLAQARPNDNSKPTQDRDADAWIKAQVGPGLARLLVYHKRRSMPIKRSYIKTHRILTLTPTSL